MANLFEKPIRREESEDTRFHLFDEEAVPEMAQPEPVRPESRQEEIPAQESRPEPIENEREAGAALSANTSGNIQMKLVSPHSGQEVVQIADYLIDGCAVILNTEHLNVQDMTRMMDFLDGVLYSIGGKHRRSSDKIFVLTPHSVDIAD